jgi:hypothetical protein
MWCRPKRNNTQLHTLHTHQVGKKKRRQVGRSCIPPPPPPLKLGSIVFGRLELLPLQSRCDRLPSRFIIIPVQFGVARVLTWVVKIISRSNRFVVFKYFFGTQKQKSSTLFVCCNQKRPENSGNQSVCVCVCVCDIDRITNPKEKNSNLNTRAGSSGLVAFTFRFFLGLSQLQKQPCVCVYVCVCVCVIVHWSIHALGYKHTSTCLSLSTCWKKFIHFFFVSSWPEFSLHPGISISNSRSVIFAQFVFLGLNWEKWDWWAKCFLDCWLQRG